MCVVDKGGDNDIYEWGLGDQCIDATPPRVLAAGQAVTANIKALCLLALSTFVCLFRSFALYNRLIPGAKDPVDDCLATALRTVSADFVSWLLTFADQAISSSGSLGVSSVKSVPVCRSDFEAQSDDIVNAKLVFFVICCNFLRKIVSGRAFCCAPSHAGLVG